MHTAAASACIVLPIGILIIVTSLLRRSLDRPLPEPIPRHHPGGHVGRSSLSHTLTADALVQQRTRSVRGLFSNYV
jgi:hypothetical protein